MNRKRAILYLFAGGLLLVCLAVLVIKKKGGGPKAPPVQVDRILVAMKTIPFGTPLVLYDQEKKTGNVFHYPWPAQMLPEGCIKDPKEIAGGRLLAFGTFVRNEPILQRMTIEKDKFVPNGMFLFDIDVPASDIDLQKFRTGDYVDIFIIGDRELTPFISCIRVFAVGRLPWLEEEGPVDPKAPPKRLPPKLYLLAREENRMELLQTRLNQRLLVEPVPPGRDCSQGPVLIARKKEEPAKIEPEPAKPAAPTVTAEQLLKDAGEFLRLSATVKYDENVKLLDKAEGIVKGLLKTDSGASAAEKAKAGDLAVAIERRRGEYALLEDWRQSKARIEDSLDKGRLTECRKLLLDAEKPFRGLVTPEGQKAADVLADFTRRLNDRDKELRMEFQLFEGFLRNKANDKAVDIYNKLKERYPESEKTAEAYERLKKANLIQ